MKALLIRNSFLQAKQLTSATTGRFCYVLQTKSAENSWNNGGPITSCSTTMVHWCILIYQCNNILLLKTHCDHPPPTHSPNLDPHEFSFLRMKSQLWGHCWQNVPEILNSCWWSKKSLPALAEVQDMLYRLRWGLAVWRGQQPIEKKASTHFIINALQELLDMPSHTAIKHNTFHKIMSCLLQTSAVCQM